MTTPRATTGTFSKGIGCLHAAVIAVVFAIALGTAGAVRQRDPTALGELTGDLLFVVGPLGFLASYLYQKGRKIPAYALVTVLWTAFPAFMWISARRLEVTDAEKRDLQVFPGRIRHPDFGFALPNPGEDFHVAPLPSAMSATMANEPVGREAFAWVFRNQDSSESVILFVFKGVGADERPFRRFVDGLRERFAAVKGATFLEDTLVWGPDAHEYRFALRLRTGVYGKVRCLASRYGPPVYVCVDTWSSASGGLDFVRAGLMLERPPAH